MVNLEGDPQNTRKEREGGSREREVSTQSVFLSKLPSELRLNQAGPEERRGKLEIKHQPQPSSFELFPRGRTGGQFCRLGEALRHDDSSESILMRPGMQSSKKQSPSMHKVLVSIRGISK